MAKELGVGIIGAGRIADLHALAYGPESRARIIAVCDANEEVASARARAWGAERSYTGYGDLLADPAVDAVEVLLPHDLHAEVAVAALRAGKPVSVQKPMARSSAEAQSMLEAAAETGVDLRVFENFRYYPPFALAKRLIDEGAIGEPQAQQITVINGTGEGWQVPVEAWLWRFDTERAGGGVCVFDHGHHIFSIARFLLGPVDEVFAWILRTPLGPYEIDQPAVISWKHRARNRIGSWQVAGSRRLQVRSQYYTSDERAQIVGERGIIWVNRCSGELTDEAPVVVYRDGKTTEYRDVESDWGASFRLGGRAWHDQLLDGGPCELTAEERLAVLRFAEAAERSAAANAPVRVEE